jgi:hypothetical protein
MDVADKDVVWPLPQPGNGDGYKRRDVRAARAFRHRLKLAWHIGLAALLATGISVVYPWSGEPYINIDAISRGDRS